MMLPKWLMALLVLLHEMYSVRRDTHLRLMKLQIELLKKRLPGNRGILDPDERRRLMKIGAEDLCRYRKSHPPIIPLIFDQSLKLKRVLSVEFSTDNHVQIRPFSLNTQTEIDSDMNTAESGKIRFTLHVGRNDAGHRESESKRSFHLTADQFSAERERFD